MWSGVQFKNLRALGGVKNDHFVTMHLDELKTWDAKDPNKIKLVKSFAIDKDIFKDFRKYADIAVLYNSPEDGKYLVALVKSSWGSSGGKLFVFDLSNGKCVQVPSPYEKQGIRYEEILFTSPSKFIAKFEREHTPVAFQISTGFFGGLSCSACKMPEDIFSLTDYIFAWPEKNLLAVMRHSPDNIYVYPLVDGLPAQKVVSQFQFQDTLKQFYPYRPTQTSDYLLFVMKKSKEVFIFNPMDNEQLKFGFHATGDLVDAFELNDHPGISLPNNRVAFFDKQYKNACCYQLSEKGLLERISQGTPLPPPLNRLVAEYVGIFSPAAIDAKDNSGKTNSDKADEKSSVQDRRL